MMNDVHDTGLGTFTEGKTLYLRLLPPFLCNYQSRAVPIHLEAVSALLPVGRAHSFRACGVLCRLITPQVI